MTFEGIISSEEFCEFVENFRFTSKELLRFTSDNRYGLRRFKFKKQDVIGLCAIEINSIKTPEELYEFCFAASGAVKLYCNFVHYVYAKTIFLPFVITIVGRNVFDGLDLSGEFLECNLYCLTKRELYSGLRLLDDWTMREILSSDVENFNGLYTAITDNNFGHFQQCVNHELLPLLSILTLKELVLKKLTSIRYIIFRKSYLIKLFSGKELAGLTTELIPSHESYHEAADEVNGDGSIEEIIDKTNYLYQLLPEYIADIEALLQFASMNKRLGRSTRQKIAKLLQKGTEFRTGNGQSTFEVCDVCVNELLKVTPFLCKFGTRIIHEEMGERETVAEWQESSIGINLWRLVLDNFKFANRKANSFKHGEHEFYKNLCVFIENILNMKKGGSKWTYALAYLFFPNHTNQNGSIDTLKGVRLNEEYMSWKNEPSSIQDVIDILAQYIPELKVNKTEKQPSLPSRCRAALKEKISQGDKWVECYIQTIWTRKAIEASDFKYLL